MRLQDVPADGITFKDLALEDECAHELQIRLRDLGILDPPVDGKFGPVSQMALKVFGKLVGQPVEEQLITKSLALALVENSSASLLPIEARDDFAGRIIKYMQLKDYWVARAPGYLNIVYVEGADADGTPNTDLPDQWNDRRLVIQIKSRRPTIVGNWDATTEPGRWYTFNVMNPKGAARIAFGQYKSWRVGFHNPGGRHEALVQVDDVTVHRDLNKDFKRTNDFTDVGSSFGVNQHWGYDSSPGKIGRASAGCLVGRTKAGHREFMALIKTDPRYKELQGYKFMSTVIAGDDLHKTFS